MDLASPLRFRIGINFEDDLHGFAPVCPLSVCVK